VIDDNWSVAGALFSRPGTSASDPMYRYSLERWWLPRGRYALWVMLNPSKGSAIRDDRTIRRVIKRTKWLSDQNSLGLAGLKIVNLFAWIDGNSAGLTGIDADVLIGNPCNDEEIKAAAAAATVTIAGWGGVNDKALRGVVEARAVEVRRWLHDPMCLGLVAGQPRHPSPKIEAHLALETEPAPW